MNPLLSLFGELWISLEARVSEGTLGKSARSEEPFDSRAVSVEIFDEIANFLSLDLNYFEATVEKGFNSDVIFKGMNFHIQSEDWGAENPYIVSRVYQSGAVIKSIKTSYSEVLGPTRRSFGQQGDAQAIRLALQEQHEKILDQLMSGQLF